MNTDELQKIVNDLTQRVVALESRVGVRVVSEASDKRPLKQVAAKEFLLAVNVSGAVEKMLALGYYLEFVANVAPFSLGDINNVFHQAKEKLPINPSDTISKNVAKGHMMQAPEAKDGKRVWVLTATGEKFINSKLPK